MSPWSSSPRGRLDRALILAELVPLLELKEDMTPERTLRRLWAKHAP